MIPINQKSFFHTHTISFGHARADWRDVVLKIFDPEKASHRMKDVLLSHHETFDNLRKHFIERHEFAYVKVKDAQIMDTDKEILKKFGIRIDFYDGWDD